VRLVNEKPKHSSNLSLYFRPKTGDRHLTLFKKKTLKKAFSVVSYKTILKLSAAEKQEIQFQFSKVHQAKPWENKFTQIKRLIQM
jgi:hypothetical protein